MRNSRLNGEKLILVIGSVISLAAAFVAPLALTGRDAEASLTAAAATFTVGYLITMEAASRARMSQVEGRLLQRIDEMEARRFGALPLQRLLSVPEIETAVTDIVQIVADARSRPMPFLANRTIERIIAASSETRQVASGVFHCVNRREELRLLRHALDDTKVSLKAVAGLGLEQWRKFEYQEYFDVYMEYADRINQERYFIVTAQELDDPIMSCLLQRHADAGVRVKAVSRTLVPEQLQCPMVVFDDRLLLLHQRRDVSGDAVQVSFTDADNRVRECTEDFASLSRWLQRSPEAVLWSSVQSSGAATRA